jgi:AcrR family transcriptional regulator
MGVIHHFGSRAELLLSLIEHLGTRLGAELATLVADWTQGGARLGALVERLADFYGSGRGRLMIALHHAGWRDPSPVLEPVVECLHAARTRCVGTSVDLDETRLAVSALHQAVALEGRFGFVFRRSAGLIACDAAAIAQRRWWFETMAERLGIPC